MTIAYAIAAMLLTSFVVGCVGANLRLPYWLTGILSGLACLLTVAAAMHL